MAFPFLKSLAKAAIFLAFVSNAEASVFLAQVSSVLPKDAKVHQVRPGDKYSDVIDKAVLTILQTPSGKSFCAAVPEDADLLKQVFFSGSSFVKQAMTACQGRFAKKWQYRIFPKAYYLVFSQSDDIAITGWTTPVNETILFFKGNQLEPERLMRSLAHELAISLDEKEKIGYSGRLDWTDNGIVKDDISCTAQTLLVVSSIKHSFSSLRAFQVETQIAHEAGYAIPSGFNKWMQLSCSDRFLNIYSMVSQFAQVFSTDSFVTAMNSAPLDCQPGLNPAKMTVGQIIDFLDSQTFEFKDGSFQNICAYMSQAFPFKAVGSFSGGPGPRIGGSGWDKMSQPKDIRSQKMGNAVEDYVRQILKEKQINKGRP